MITLWLLSISLMFSYFSKTCFFPFVSFDFKNLVFIKSIKTILARRTVALQVYCVVSVFVKDPRNLDWKADGTVIFLEFLFASVENFDAIPLVQAYLSKIVHHLFISPIICPQYHVM